MISIIIPTLNVSTILKDCLDSIRNQTYKNYEIIIVDDHSNDGTQELAKKYCAKVLTYNLKKKPSNFNIFRVPAQQNYGISLCQGDIIYLVDSDMRLNSTLLENCINEIKEKADAIIIPEVSIGKTFWAKCKGLEKKGYVGNLLETPRFLKKSVWKEINGLDEEVGGFYDWALTDRLVNNGYTMIRVNDFVIHDEGNLTLKKLVKKKYIYGKYLQLYLKKYKFRENYDGNPLLSRLTPFRFMHYHKEYNPILKRPILFVGLLIMKIIEFMAIIIGAMNSNIQYH